MKVYTRTGDKGETSLLGGVRVSKADPRIELVGNLDSLNSYIGILISYIPKKHLELGLLQHIQSLIFDTGAEVANPRITLEQFASYDHFITELEEHIDRMDSSLPALKYFILPGGHISASYSHLCRAEIRVCERSFVKIKASILETKENSNFSLNDSAGKFLNRLSDYFFVLARFLNQENGIEDMVWKKRK